MNDQENWYLAVDVAMQIRRARYLDFIYPAQRRPAAIPPNQADAILKTRERHIDDNPNPLGKIESICRLFLDNPDVLTLTQDALGFDYLLVNNLENYTSGNYQLCSQHRGCYIHKTTLYNQQSSPL